MSVDWAKGNPFLSAPFRVLSDDQAQAIHEASLRILQQTGYHTPVLEARRLLQEAGARVEGERAYIPSDLVENALRTVNPLRLYDRQGHPTSLLQPGHVAFSTIADTFYIRDPYTHSVRPFLMADQGWLATVIDALPGIEYVQCVGQAHDVPDSLQSQVAVSETLRRTSKPILVYPYDRAGLLDILDMLYVIAGGETAFQKKPFLMCAAVPGAPLFGTVYSLELLLTCAERRVPVLNYACPAIGGNSPASITGTLVLTNADWLANLTIHQLKNPGAPIATAGFTVQLMDMKSTLWSYCAPETLLAYSAVADLAHWYGMPAFGLEMTCDIPQVNAQMGVEMFAQCQRAFLSQVEMVHNAGIIGAGKLCAAEAVILADEIIAYTRAAMQPISTSPEHIDESIRMIAEEGPMGEYISHAHTLEHFRDFWYPGLFDRSRFDPVNEVQGSSLEDRLNAKARQLFEQHKPVLLDEDINTELDAIETRWYARSEALRT
jgi:trimethylamine--corrinoid protein Co-methyltransferase